MSPSKKGPALDGGQSRGSALLEPLQFVASQNWSGGVLTTADPSCLDEAISQSNLPVRSATDQLTDPDGDPFLWFSLAPTIRTSIATSYVTCVDDVQQLRQFIAMGTINVVDAGCIAERWRDELDPATIASSLALGLQELTPVQVQGMVADVVSCWSDATWWVDDVALELEGTNGLNFDQANCIARELVDSFGIEPIVRRRVLNIDVLALPDDQLAAIVAVCDAPITLSSWEPSSTIGNCIANLYSDDVDYTAVPCDQPHTAEVLGVQDLSTTFPDYPGGDQLQQASADMCIAIADQLPADPTAGVTWLWPSRETWERGHRTVSCLLIKQDGSDWDGPSGIVP